MARKVALTLNNNGQDDQKLIKYKFNKSIFHNIRLTPWIELLKVEYTINYLDEVVEYT